VSLPLIPGIVRAIVASVFVGAIVLHAVDAYAEPDDGVGQEKNSLQAEHIDRYPITLSDYKLP